MITRLAIKNSVVTLSILFVLIISGISVFNTLPRDDMPPFLVRVITIVTSYPGASPERVENLVTEKIERVVQEVPEVNYVKSESRNGISIIRVVLKESEFDLQPIFDRIRRKVEGVKHKLPASTRMVINDELGDVFGIILGLTAEGYTYSEMKDIADDIRDELIRMPSVAKVKISGAQDERIYVEFDDARLAESGVSQRDLENIIAQTNIVGSGGDINVDDRRIILEPSGDFESIDDLRQLIVSYSGNEIVRLGDIANVRRGYISPEKSLVKINGVRGLSIAINLKEKGNLLELGREVEQKIKEFREIYPYGVEISRLASQDIVVAKTVNAFVSNLIQAIIVVLLVMLAFLGFRTGMVVASLIPATMIISLFLMSVFGLGLNKVTLAALIIALGLLVDNAIVISEAIVVKIEKGSNALDAAIASSKEMMVPLLTSSLTTSSAFMAFFLAETILGELMGNIFSVLSIALFTSWFLSLTMIPLLCIYALKVSSERRDKLNDFKGLNVFYQKVLQACLRRPFMLVGVILMLFVVSVYGVRFVPTIFMPKSDRALVTLNIEFPLGLDIVRTEKHIGKIDQFVADQLFVNKGKKEGVISWSSFIGEGAPKYDLGYMPPESSSNIAHMLLNTTSDGANDEVINKLDAFIYADFPDATYQVSRLTTTNGASTHPLEVRVSGEDPEQLYKIASEVKQHLAGIPGTKNISDDWGQRSQKLFVDIQPSKAQIASVSNQDVAVSLQTLLTGKQIGSYREGIKVIPIIMQNQRSQALSIEGLGSANVYAQQGHKNVPLSQVAEVNLVWQASRILHRDLLKTITVKSEVSSDYNAAEIASKLKPLLQASKQNWGRGYDYALGGDDEGSRRAMSAVIEKLPISGFIIVLLLVAQFNSIRKPLIILATIPLGLIGVVFGLLITDSYFGFLAFLGIISLSGIVINNGIVLLDRIKFEEQGDGVTQDEAIIAACLQRIRPILLTTATTSFGLVPLWLGGGVLWEPMAISIIFGLIFSTVLTLLFIPVLYSLLFSDKIVDYKHSLKSIFIK